VSSNQIGDLVAANQEMAMAILFSIALPFEIAMQFGDLLMPQEIQQFFQCGKRPCYSLLLQHQSHSCCSCCYKGVNVVVKKGR
jgi:hypothetical protein